MTDFEVTFMCNPVDNFDDVAIAFYDNFDGVISQRDGRLRVTVEFQAGSGSTGAAQAIDNLIRLGITPTRVDRDLVDASEIAARLERTRQAVQQWGPVWMGSV